MENPYYSPESDLATSATGVTKRSVWWKIYFFIISILSFLGMISFLFSDGAGAIDYFEFILLVVATVGLYGFVFSKKILFSKFWIPYLVVYFIFGLLYESLSSVDMRQGMSDSVYYISIAVGYLISLPAYYGLYQYGKADKSPWSNA